MEYKANINNVELTEAQLKEGLAQIEEKRKQNRPFNLGEVVEVYAAPPPASRIGDRRIILGTIDQVKEALYIAERIDGRSIVGIDVAGDMNLSMPHYRGLRFGNHAIWRRPGYRVS